MHLTTLLLLIMTAYLITITLKVTLEIFLFGVLKINLKNTLKMNRLKMKKYSMKLPE